MKDDSGSYAVFTEQGSSASQMTAAKVMDIISRLPGCTGQAQDAVSDCTQVKMEDAPTLLKIPESFLDHFFNWVALKRQGRLARILWILTEVCSNQGFLPGLKKNYQKQSHGET